MEMAPSDENEGRALAKVVITQEEFKVKRGDLSVAPLESWMPDSRPNMTIT